ncbi:FixH family protein [Lysinibacillus sp. FSL K6-0232]|uniref:FixH family protein n=1 Tax=unclassified Lysinibacillus TaxID=2636778 RepID=UPI0030FBE887
MKKWLYALIAVPVLLVGCGDKKEQAALSEPEVPQVPEVEILTPEAVAPNETIELSAHVQQGGENVDDAIVEFEVWESGKRDEGQMIDGKLDKDGVYKATTTFDHDGVYYMYAHTTANGVHSMPKQEIIAGSPDMTQVLPEDEDANNSMDHEMMEHNHDSSDKEDHNNHEKNHH